MRWMNNARVGVRLAVAFGLVGLLLVAMGAVAFWGFNEQGKTQDRIVEDLSDTHDAMQVKYRSADVNGLQLAYALDALLGTEGVDDDAGARQEFLASVESFRDELAAILGDDDITPEERVVADRLVEELDRYMDLDEEIVAGYRAGTPEAAQSASQLVAVDAVAISDRIETATDELVALIDEGSAEDAEDAEQRATRDKSVMVTAAVLALLLGGVLATLISRSLSRPLGRTVSLLQSVAEGDLTQRSDATTDDEVGQMNVALNHTLDRVADTVQGIGASAATLSTASEELSAVSQQLSAAAEETAVQAASVSAGAEQVSHNIQSVSTGAEELGASIQEIAQSTTMAARIAGEAVDAANATNETMAKLGASSAEIGEVIKVITSIAEQTKLLALNATIEAARAGEAGKGFAVVANEVKDLARATARSSEEIGRTIETIQTDTAAAVEAIDRITGIIRQINDIQTVIAAAVEEQSATTNEIGRNVSEAAVGSGDIARNITGVAETARSTTQGASETHTAAEELARLASELLRLVGQFRVSDGRR